MELLIIWIICGTIAAVIANVKGRSVVGWFFGGAFLGLIGIIIVACLSNKKEEQEYRQHVDQENRRLREKLDQERIKSEVFRRHAAARIDSHDKQLGIDTRSATAALPNYSEPPMELAAPENPDSSLVDAESVASVPPPAQPPSNARMWFFEQNGKSRGPVLEPELIGLFHAGSINGDTLVWTEQLGKWIVAKRVKGLKPYIQS